MEKTKKIGQVFLPDSLICFVGLVHQLVVLASEARKEHAIAVAALDSHLENLKFWF